MKISYFLLPILIKGFYLSWSSLNKIHRMNSSKNNENDITYEEFNNDFSEDENYISPEMLEYLLDKQKNTSKN